MLSGQDTSSLVHHSRLTTHQLMADVTIELLGPEDLSVVVDLYNRIFRPHRDLDCAAGRQLVVSLYGEGQTLGSLHADACC